MTYGDEELRDLGRRAAAGDQQARREHRLAMARAGLLPEADLDEWVRRRLELVQPRRRRSGRLSPGDVADAVRRLGHAQSTHLDDLEVAFHGIAKTVETGRPGADPGVLWVAAWARTASRRGAITLALAVGARGAPDFNSPAFDRARPPAVERVTISIIECDAAQVGERHWSLPFFDHLHEAGMGWDAIRVFAGLERPDRIRVPAGVAFAWAEERVGYSVPSWEEAPPGYAP